MITISDIDRWNVADIEKVFQVCADHADHCDQRATDLGSLETFQTWDGQAADAAKSAIGKTRKDFDDHGNHVSAVAAAAKTAADEVATIKTKLGGLRDQAAKGGLGIGDDGQVTRTVQGPYTQDRLNQIEARRSVLQLEVNQLLINAEKIDHDLATAIKGADGEINPDDLNKQNHPPVWAALYGMGSLGLPEYPDHSLTDEEARNWYVEAEKRIAALKDTILNDPNLTMDEKARMVFEMRNEVRSKARDLMANRTGAAALNQSDPNWEYEDLIRDKMNRKGLTREQAVQDLFDSSTKSRTSVNQSLGVDPENPKLPDPNEVRSRPGVSESVASEGGNFGSKALKFAGRAAIPLAAGFVAWDNYEQVQAGNKSVPQAVVGGVGTVGGMIAGAEYGGAAGAFAGPVGVVVGGVVGGTVGAFVGGSLGDWIGGWFD
ncbi:phage head morphogenesis protein [Nocardia panacis]|uniref:Phage head morphogenesis protein n=1 Tax=Nocardia panacis TaxID=2340916 RepID=A0A3A4L696_9NOCA|nr:phage head morphogenesis protein [Nocardia panacis]RJO78276.1 phage head morphogenesis protein [Nocardia panacis]